MESMDKGHFFGLSDEDRTFWEGRAITIRGLFEGIAVLSQKYHQRNIILVDVGTGRCVDGESFVDILSVNGDEWPLLWIVAIESIRIDFDHISVIYDSEVEQSQEGDDVS